MSSIYNRSALKKATNITINSDLLKKAKMYNINISQTVEKHLVNLIKEIEKNKWLEENAEAMKKQNERIEKLGAFSDRLRRF